MLSALFDHLWQSTLLVGMAGLLTLALRKNRARVRHWVWLAASCKFLIPLSVLIALGGQIQWRTAPEIPQSDPYFSYVMDEVSRPFTSPAVSAPSAESRLPALLSGLWICGFLGIACSWWIRWRRIAATVRAASPVQLDLPIQAKSSPTLLEPGVFGIFQPVLLLPEGIFDRLTPEQLKAILTHELCHVRNRDNLIAAIHMFVETVFWFHPLVWWIGKRMVAERERACDEEVLRLGNEPRAYAEGILNVCKMYVESPLVCVSGVTGADLKKRIEGIMSRGRACELNFGKAVLLVMAGIGAIAVPVAVGMLNAPLGRAQSKVEAFEVASVKPSRTDDRRMYIDPLVGGRVTARNVALGWLVQFAYDIRWNQISGGPGWSASDRFDVIARDADGTAGKDRLRLMMRTLLAERFNLKLHTETKDEPIYALVMAKAGTTGGPELHKAAACPPAPISPPAGSEPAPCPAFWMTTGGQLGALSGTMGEFAKVLIDVTHRTVRDRTGLSGAYDFRLSWTPDQATPGAAGDPGAPPPDSAGPSIFTALQEQLGLKLQAERGPVEFYVIDHVEKPSEN